eukprot:1115310-Rhodomonas_salina.2
MACDPARESNTQEVRQGNEGVETRKEVPRTKEGWGMRAKMKRKHARGRRRRERDGERERGEGSRLSAAPLDQRRMQGSEICLTRAQRDAGWRGQHTQEEAERRENSMHNR